MILSSVTLIGFVAILFSIVCALGYTTQADAVAYFIDQPQVIHDETPAPGIPENLSNNLPEPDLFNWFNGSMAILAVITLVAFLKLRWYRLDVVELVNPHTRWIMGLFLIAFALYVAQNLGYIIVSSFLEGSPAFTDEATADESLYASSVIRFVIYAASLPVLIISWVCITKSRHDLERYKKKYSVVKIIILSFFAIVLIYPVVSTAGEAARIIVELFTDKISNPVAHETLSMLMESTSEKWKWIMCSLVVIGAPVVEETLYRGLLQQGIKPLVGSRWISILAVSVLFTLMHVTAVPEDSRFALASLFVLSVGLGFVYEKTQSLIAPILVHALFNAINLVLAFSDSIFG